MMSDKVEGVPKIVDFGFAKIVGPSEQLIDHYGSQGYVAPEILLKEKYQKEVDVWSLGVVLYVLLSGALPFASFNREEMDRQVINKNVPFDEPCFENCEPDLKDLILKMLEKDKEDRITV
jgi:calcium/calmodulin-dependent protein kinase I